MTAGDRDAGLKEKINPSVQSYEGMRKTRTTLKQLREIRKKLAEVRAKTGPLADTIDALSGRLAALEVSLPACRRAQPNAGEAGYSRIGTEFQARTPLCR